MAKIKIMKAIDDFLFKQCDEFKKSQVYSSLTDANANIEDEMRPWLNILLSSLFFIIFLGIIFSFLFTNTTLKSKISDKEKIGEEAAKYLELEKRASPLFSQLIANPRMDSQGQFKDEILSSAGTITQNKISVQDFSQNSLSQNISKVTATINFKSINNEDLSFFVKLLSVQKKIQFIETTISRNPQTELISGSMEILQYSR